ncbi:RNA-guided endonuclease TnpB family protein [Planosporangium flavigriseum]|uniref:Transposase n=1 Tax=Planosporangium flavigriseum TaxID=373681 RepID=A0A8J3M1G8_9ACTN|nr:RNA-guided endonuclease TnpB family protein [Planosporangium flavigriseum]GIG74985.1 hypothetical protein Pfl04_33890 [Planosporangium flavigriseum]
MQLRYNYRVYPDAAQREALARAFGCARVVFNDGLRARQNAREQGLPYLSDGQLSKQVITQAKATPEREWLGEVSAVVLQQALADLNVAYRNFFASITGKRKGRKVAPPRLRSRKDNRQAIRFTANARFKVGDNGRLRLPKIGGLDVRWSRSLPSEPSSVTIVKDAAGRYFASFVVQTTQDEPLPEADAEVGIDLGLTHFAVLSDGTKVAAPKFLRRAARKLKRLQQDLSRKTKGSNRRKKAVVKVAKAHARVADTRRDWQHQLSTAIIRDNQAVYVEDLCVAGLGRTRLAKSVHDAGWASFTAMLEYKAARYGRTFAKIDRFFPSTRMCSQYGRVNDKMALTVRAWDCPCGAAHDRDVNAAMNVLAAGRAESLNDRGAHVRPALVPAARREAVIHPRAARVPRAARRESPSFRPASTNATAARIVAVSPPLPVAGCAGVGSAPAMSAPVLVDRERTTCESFDDAGGAEGPACCPGAPGEPVPGTGVPLLTELSALPVGPFLTGPSWLPGVGIAGWPAVGCAVGCCWSMTGTPGAVGRAGRSGTAGTAGTTGTAGTAGRAGRAGRAGTSGAAGTVGSASAPGHGPETGRHVSALAAGAPRTTVPGIATAAAVSVVAALRRTSRTQSIAAWTSLRLIQCWPQSRTRQKTRSLSALDPVRTVCDQAMLEIDSCGTGARRLPTGCRLPFGCGYLSVWLTGRVHSSG